MRYGVIVLVLVCLLGMRTDFAPAQEKTDADKHLAAAHELLVTMHLDKTFGESLEKMVDLQIKQNPKIAPFRKVMLEFFQKYMSWEGLKDDMAKIYVDEFTLEELNDLITFYKTPTGQKAALRLPQLMTKGGELGMRRVQDHIAELQQMIAEEAKKAEQK